MPKYKASLNSALQTIVPDVVNGVVTVIVISSKYPSVVPGSNSIRIWVAVVDNTLLKGSSPQAAAVLGVPHVVDTPSFIPKTAPVPPPLPYLHPVILTVAPGMAGVDRT